MSAQALTVPPVEALKEELEMRRVHRLQEKAATYPRKNPILSDIGDCDRQVAYGVTNWQDKKPADTELLARFEAGNVAEREMIKQLLEMGFDWVGGQDSIVIKGRGDVLLATGRIDGFIKWKGERIPVEFKSMHPNVFAQVDSIEDFQKKPWLRKYIRQLMMYMFGNNKEYGLFGVTNCLGAIKWFVLYLDLGECELLLQRLESVAQHLKNTTLPDRIKYDRKVCGNCDFAVRCLPDLINKPAEIIDNEELEAAIARHEEIYPFTKEYDALHEKLKDTFRGIDKATVGARFIVLNIPGERTVYELPQDVEEKIEMLKSPYAVKKPMMRLSIQDLGK